jgi:hypothetical protein
VATASRPSSAQPAEPRASHIFAGPGDSHHACPIKVIARKTLLVLEFVRCKNKTIFCLFNHEVKRGGEIICLALM